MYIICYKTPTILFYIFLLFCDILKKSIYHSEQDFVKGVKMWARHSWGIQKSLWPATTCHYPYSFCWPELNYFLCSVERGNLWMTYWKGCGRKWSWPILRHHLSAWMEWLRNTMKTLNHDISPPGPDFKLRPPKHEAGVLTSLPQSQQNIF
jgi:hypothetical protein